MLDLDTSADFPEGFVRGGTDSWALGEIQHSFLATDILNELSICKAFEKQRSKFIDLGFGQTKRLDQGIAEKLVVRHVLAAVVSIHITNNRSIEDGFAKPIYFVARALRSKYLLGEVGNFNLARSRSPEKTILQRRTDFHAKWAMVLDAAKAGRLTVRARLSGVLIQYRSRYPERLAD